jgi:hypothetical protein
MSFKAEDAAHRRKRGKHLNGSNRKEYLLTRKCAVYLMHNQSFPPSLLRCGLAGLIYTRHDSIHPVDASVMTHMIAITKAKPKPLHISMAIDHDRF